MALRLFYTEEGMDAGRLCLPSPMQPPPIGPSGGDDAAKAAALCEAMLTATVLDSRVTPVSLAVQPIASPRPPPMQQLSLVREPPLCRPRLLLLMVPCYLSHHLRRRMWSACVVPLTRIRSCQYPIGYGSVYSD